MLALATEPGFAGSPSPVPPAFAPHPKVTVGIDPAGQFVTIGLPWIGTAPYRYPNAEGMRLLTGSGPAEYLTESTYQGRAVYVHAMVWAIPARPGRRREAIEPGRVKVKKASTRGEARLYVMAKARHEQTSQLHRLVHETGVFGGLYHRGDPVEMILSVWTRKTGAVFEERFVD